MKGKLERINFTDNSNILIIEKVSFKKMKKEIYKLLDNLDHQELQFCYDSIINELSNLDFNKLNKGV